jgi:hypothetical protein
MSMTRLFVLAGLALATAGCGSGLSRAIDDYEAGRATHAIARLRALAARGEHGDRQECARYALFRGLAHLTLGDALAAEHWLRSLKQQLELDPGLLSGSEKSRLQSALGALGQLPGD